MAAVGRPVFAGRREKGSRHGRESVVDITPPAARAFFLFVLNLVVSLVPARRIVVPATPVAPVVIVFVIAPSPAARAVVVVVVVVQAHGRPLAVVGGKSP